MAVGIVIYAAGCVRQLLPPSVWVSGCSNGIVILAMGGLTRFMRTTPISFEAILCGVVVLNGVRREAFVTSPTME